jgi:hypothetical protein
MSLLKNQKKEKVTEFEGSALAYKSSLSKNNHVPEFLTEGM